MNVTDLETFVVGNPPPHRGGRYFIFVKLTCDTGTTGIGEVYTATFGPENVVHLVEDMFDRHLRGRDPRQIEQFFRTAYGAGYSMRPDATVLAVASGLEMACWDIFGKEIGQPVHMMLGGRLRDRLRSYTYIYPPTGSAHPVDADGPNVYNDPDLAATCAAEYVAEGFTALKFDPAGPYSVHDGHQPELETLERCEQFARRLREAVGNRSDLLLGTHGQFTASGAIRLARRLERYDLLWFEEPVPPDMPEEMAKVARSTRIPIATGERLCTKWEFARVLENGAASIFQMNLGRVGGILEAKKIAGMAETRHVQLAPHLYCGPVVAAANIQLAACSPNFLILETIHKLDGFYAELLVDPLEWEDGYVLVPDGPGLGIELDEAVARANPYTGTELHLDMVRNPV